MRRVVMDLRSPSHDLLDSAGAGAGAAVLEAVVRPTHTSDLGRFSQRLRALSSLSTRLVLTDVKMPAYDEMVRGVWRVLGCDTCALYVLNAAERCLDLVGHAGFEPTASARRLSLDDLDRCEVQALLEEYTVNVGDVIESSELKATTAQVRSVLAFPVQAAEGPVGVFSFGSFAADGFGPDDIDMGGMVVDQMTYMLENFRLVRQLSESRDAVIRGMAIMAESRSADIGGHLDRISAYCRLLATRLRGRPLAGGRIDEPFVEMISRAALLHDLGKVGIPDTVLLKPGRLTDAEFEIMRSHSDIGAQILGHLMEVHGAFPMLEMGAQVARSHHERWDGAGYPDGLHGRNIPLVARIVSLADVYDALTSERVYKDAWSHGAAVKYLHEQSGRLFDPELTAALLANDRELLAIREQHPD
jgi:HD-GYP domain-containing protein (c-di-GMP phosphodiesterase class II)